MTILANAVHSFLYAAALLLVMLPTTPGCSPDTAREKELLLATDAAFCTTAVAKGVPEAFLLYMTDDAVLLPMNDHPIAGREAIHRHLSAGGGSGSLTWTPLRADVSMAGDLGYTYGTYMLRGTDSTGAPIERYGKYVTIWKKQTDGTWKFVLDTGNPSPPPPTR